MSCVLTELKSQGGCDSLQTLFFHKQDGPAAVTFGSLELLTDFPVRVWSDNGTITNDMLNVGTYLNGGGMLVPTMMTEGVEFAQGAAIVVGTIAKTSPNPAVKGGWAVKRRAIDGDEVNETIVLKKGVGLQVMVR